MGHAHSSAHTLPGGGGGSAAVARMVDAPPHLSPSSPDSPGAGSRWPSRFLSADQIVELRAGLKALLKALADERHFRNGEGECTPPAILPLHVHGSEETNTPTSRAVSPTGSPGEAVIPMQLLQSFEEIHLSGYQLGDAALTSANPPDLPSFLSVVPQHTRLRVLDLSFNRLTQTVVTPLLEAVRALPVLEVLKLSGNRLGSTCGGGGDDGNLSMWDLSTVTIAELEASSTAAAQLGCWLATNPPLRELALFHCELNDSDVRAVLAGLVHPRNTVLVSLQLAWNPLCTSHSARMALQLVTHLGNTSLCELELEGAPPARQTRLEYACTSDGVFHSGDTLFTMNPSGASSAIGSSDPSKKADCTDAHETSCDSVDLEQLRWQQQQLATVQTRLTPAQVARYGSRCRFLMEDFDGRRVLPPLVMRELASVLSTRSRPPPRIAKPVDAVAPTAQLVTPPSPAGVEEDRQDDDDTRMHTPTKDEERSSSDSHENEPPSSPVKNNIADSSSRVSRLPSIEAAAAETAAAAASNGTRFSPIPHPPDLQRPRTCAPVHLHTGRNASAAPRRRRSPQEMRDTRFERPQRIATVLADADVFRRRRHPLQVDTFAPPCAEVSRHRRCAHSASAARARAAWYTDEHFILRPNGLTNVLVAPVPHRCEALYNHVAMVELQDRALIPCWCTPRQTTSSTGIFAGTLHYHCVHEITAQQEKQQYGTSSASAARPALSASSKKLLPSLRPETAKGRPKSRPPPPEELHKIYCGCKATRHLCVSECVAQEEARTGRHRRRMRTMLLEKASKSADKSPVKTCGAASFRKAAHSPDCTSTDVEAADNSVGSTSMSGPPIVYMRTIHTRCGPVSVALNYNPVSHFTAPHVASASDMTLAEL